MVSSRDRPIASRLASSVFAVMRVCTMDECRYRLCGITVAPRMPMARYSGSRWLTACHEGINPAATEGQCGLMSTSSTK